MWRADEARWEVESAWRRKSAAKRWVVTESDHVRSALWPGRHVKTARGHVRRFSPAHTCSCTHSLAWEWTWTLAKTPAWLSWSRGSPFLRRTTGSTFVWLRPSTSLAWASWRCSSWVVGGVMWQDLCRGLHRVCRGLQRVCRGLQRLCRDYKDSVVVTRTLWCLVTERMW